MESALPSRAHPRSRGENGVVSLGVGQREGSSPLTRGKRDPSADRTNRGGLIPAHAGKTRGALRVASAQQAHPRSRGENIRSILGEYADDGSSPLTRGKLIPPSPGTNRLGLIPAHAGKTVPLKFGGKEPRAHPRSRGENGKVFPEWYQCLGSSPLTRGKPFSRRNPAPTCRLIPAHAGKTRGRLGLRAATAAHPRSRGENGYRFDDGDDLVGSSPLTRGKPPPTGRA